MQKTKKIRKNCLFLEKKKKSGAKQDNESITCENLKLWTFQLCIGLARTGHTLYSCLDRVVIRVLLLLIQSRALSTTYSHWAGDKKQNIVDGGQKKEQYFRPNCIFATVVSFCTSFNSKIVLEMSICLPEETCLLQLIVSTHCLHINRKVKDFTFFFLQDL